LWVDQEVLPQAVLEGYAVPAKKPLELMVIRGID
jgi:hypothetical protein